MQTPNQLQQGVRTAPMLLIVTAVLWSLGGVLIKSIEWHPLAIAASRSAISAAVIWIYLRKPHFTFSRDQIGGAICYTITVALFVMANKLTTAANAIVLQYTAPVYVALFGAWFLGERASRNDLIMIAIVLCGVALFFFDSLTADSLLGIAIALASGISMAWMTIFVRKQHQGSSLESLLLGNILTALCGLPFILSAPAPTSNGILLVVLLGIVQLGIPYILYAKALKHVTALEAILLTMLEPILNPLWVLFARGETPGTFALLGSIVVLGVVTLRSVYSVRSLQQ